MDYKIFPCEIKECLENTISRLGGGNICTCYITYFSFGLLILTGLFTFISPYALIYISFYATVEKVGLTTTELYNNFTKINHGVTYNQEIDKLTYVNAPFFQFNNSDYV